MKKRKLGLLKKMKVGREEEAETMAMGPKIPSEAVRAA